MRGDPDGEALPIRSHWFITISIHSRADVESQSSETSHVEFLRIQFTLVQSCTLAKNEHFNECLRET
jgi:hypothetical protein